MRKSMWGPFPKERSPKGWIVTAVALLLVLGALTGGLFAFSPRGPLSAHAQSATGGGWLPTGSLPAARGSHTATLLSNGQVLVAGGLDSNNSALATAYLYDPATARWTQTGSMQTPRYKYTATLLPNGKVLVAGGTNLHGAMTAAELYDPTTGTWTPTGSMQTPRDDYTATLLPNGKVLVTGGELTGQSGAPTVTSTAELYDPATGTWTPTGSLNQARGGHTATLLPNGKVLVAGGYQFQPNGHDGLASAELYDPATGTWATTASLNASRWEFAAALLPNGKVLVVAGFDSGSTVELYNPATGIWTTIMFLNSMALPTATLLSTGQVLVAGSDNAPQLYDPATGTWTPAGSMITAREGDTATLLPNGQVLVVGGLAPLEGPVLASAEIFDPQLTNIAPQASVSASSETPGSGASKAIDGVIDGYPHDQTKEWATQGGGAGSWLELQWPSSQIVSEIVLYDRPNANDQVTGGTIQFSDGSSVPVGPLHNDGSATVLAFPARPVSSLRLTITAVSGTTLNIGLAEIQVYSTGTTSLSGANIAPGASVSASSETAGSEASKVVDGVIDGWPHDPSKEWATQGGGAGSWLQLTWSRAQTVTGIALYDRLNLNDQVTAGTIQFSDGSTLAVGTLTNDGSATILTFPARSITSLRLTITTVSGTTLNTGLAEIQVYTTSLSGTNVASQASVSASSETPGSEASKAIDGVIDGYPNDPSKEWATQGGRAGSWLQLTWSRAQTVTGIVLYDRLNLNDQVTGGTIQFSDGSTLVVGTLHNDGSATILTFPARSITSLRLTITTVSSTTFNIGLAEIQVYAQ